jgi:hypothetical protein
MAQPAAIPASRLAKGDQTKRERAADRLAA